MEDACGEEASTTLEHEEGAGDVMDRVKQKDSHIVNLKRRVCELTASLELTETRCRSVACLCLSYIFVVLFYFIYKYNYETMWKHKHTL